MNWKLPLSLSMETFVAVRTKIAGVLIATVFVLGVATSATPQDNVWIFERR
jgi:hypothetical protein